MKTYEQMARDVLKRIDDVNVKRQHRRQNVLRAAVAVSCAVLTVLAGAGIPSLMPKESTTSSDETVKPIATSVLQIAYLSENGWDRSVMEQQTETQMRYKLSVVDTRGMTAAQRQALWREMVAKQEQELLEFIPEFYSGQSLGGGGVNNGWDNALFVTYRAGVFWLDIDEKKKVESISAECDSIYGEAEFYIYSKNFVGKKVAYQAKWYDGTEQHTEKETRHGNVYLYAKGVALDGDTYDLIQSDGGFYIRWKPSSKLYEVLNEDPNKALSDFFDQMTITVNYADGSLESHLLDIVFHDDGNIGAVYQGFTQAEE